MPMLIKTKLKEVPGKGIGLIADEFIRKGQVVYKDDSDFDRIIPKGQLLKMSPELKEFVKTYASFNSKTNTYYLCCDNARFWNHSDSPNTTYNPDNGLVTALRDIQVEEELTADYRDFCDYCKKEDFGFQILP